MINTKFWNDNWIRDLNPLERYVFLYFLTNEHTDICGVYELPIATIAFETGVKEKVVKQLILPKLKDKIRYKEGWVGIVNFAKYQLNNPKVKIGIKAGFERVPSKILEIMEFKSDEQIQIFKRKGLSGTTKKDIHSKFNEECCICGSSDKLEIDHIVEVSKGGSNNKDNLRLMCLECHKKRHQNIDYHSLSYINSNINLNSKVEGKPSKDPSLIKNQPFSLSGEIKKLEDNPRREMNIIALYFDYRKPDLQTYEQYEIALGRHMKAAKKLISFKDEQLIKAIKVAEKEYKDIYTLETLAKILTK